MANDLERSNKLNSAMRYGGTAASAVFAVMGALSILTPDQVTTLKADIETLKTSILTGYGALVDMWVILGPVGVLVLAKIGWNSSGVKAMAGKLFAIATTPSDPKSTEAKVAIVNAAASPAIGSLGVVNKDLAANPETSANVVAAPELVPKKPS